MTQSRPTLAIAVNSRFGEVVRWRAPVAESDLMPSTLLHAITRALEGVASRLDVVEADAAFGARITALKPDYVMNFSYGVQGASRQSLVPSVLEMLGIDYLGSDPYVHGLLLHKTHTKLLVEALGVRTPRGFLVDGIAQLDQVPAWPRYIAKPNADMNSTDVHCIADRDALAHTVGAIVDRHGACLVEEYIPGVDVTVGIIGSGGTARALPPLAFSPTPSGIRERQTKKSRIRCSCPPSFLTGDQIAELERLSIRIHRHLGCRDFSRIDYRVDADGEVYFLEANSSPGLTPNSPFVHAAETVGHSRDDLFRMLFDTMVERTRD